MELLVFSLVNGYPDVHIVQNTANCTPNMDQQVERTFKLIETEGKWNSRLIFLKESFGE